MGEIYTRSGSIFAAGNCGASFLDSSLYPFGVRQFDAIEKTVSVPGCRIKSRGIRMDKRLRRRIPLKLAGRIETKDQNGVDGLTRNISAIGAYFDAENTIPVGTEVELEVFLPVEELREMKGREARMKVSGTVVRVEEGGVAVFFKGLKFLLREE